MSGDEIFQRLGFALDVETDEDEEERMEEQPQVEQGPREPRRKFDAREKDCFGPFINLTDRQVTTLVLEMNADVHRQGEYDQDDVVALPFDAAADLVAVAEELWRFRLRQGWHDDEDSDQPPLSMSDPLQ